MRVIRVLLAGEHRLLQDTIAGLLRTQGDIRVLATVTSASDTIHLATELRPDVILLEPWSRAGTVLHTLSTLRGLVPQTSIVLTPTTCVTVPAVLRVTHQVLPRDAGQDVLLKTVRTLAGEEARHPEQRPASPLSRRETEVLSAAAEAMTNQQIARVLGITTGTVKRHMHAAFRKLGAVSRLDAVSKAYLAGLLPLHPVPVAVDTPRSGRSEPDQRRSPGSDVDLEHTARSFTSSALPH